MAGKKVGSDGQVRKTTAEWAADTATYPEGMRLMDTDTGTVRVSKGTTYAQAWVQSSGGGASAWGDITGTLSDQTDLQAYLETLANGIGAVTDLLPEKSYVAALSQVMTGNITATVIQNTYGGTPVFARVTTGEYTITLAGAWTAGTTVDVTNSVVSVGTDLRGFINYRVASTDVIELTCEDVDRVPQDIENTNFSIHIQS